MPMPYLPPEIWQRISTHLPPASLSTLTKVCCTFTEIGTEEQHFRRHLRICQTDTNPALLFRRLQAWLSPQPHIRYTNQPSSPLSQLCIVEDTMILVDISNFRLITFPFRKTVKLQHLIGDIALGDNISTHWELARFKSCFTIVPDASIVFINWNSPTTLTILNVSTWEVIKHVIPERKITTKKALNDAYMVLAGNQGEYIMYFTDQTTLVLVDWRTGKLVKEYKEICEHIRYIFGECPSINCNTIVGLVAQRNDRRDGSLTDVFVTGFDGVEIDFAIADCQTLFAVLRSADAKTHVLIAYNSTDSSDRQYEFVAYRNNEDSMQSWSGYLTTMSSLRLQNNGRIIASRHKHKLKRSGKGETSERKMVYVELKDDGTTEELYIPELNNPGRVIWHRPTFDGGFAVIGSCSGLVQLVRLVNDDEAEKEHLIKSWKVEGLSNLTVLADHIIVAELVDGSLKWFHFDRFCRGVEGAYVCPLTDPLANFQFTEEATDEEAEEPDHKRTRRF